MSAPRHQPRKKKKDKKRGKDKSGSTSKIMVAAPARGRPQGRYAKREAGKMVKGVFALAFRDARCCLFGRHASALRC
jgi:hypothetical protein